MDQVRSFSLGDLDVISDILKSSLTLDPELTTDLIKFRIFEDPNFDPELSLVRTVDGRIVSMVCATNPKDSPEIAWIKVFATDREFRNRRFGSQLFELLFDTLQKRGVTEVRFSDRGNWHFWPGIDLNYEDALDFLLEQGFKKDGEYVDYFYDVSKFFYPRRILRLKQHLEREGVKFQSVDPLQKDETLEWIEKNFNFFWRNEAEFALKRSEPSLFIAREKTGEILGFATINGVVPGRFGPMGVDYNQRRRGIGTVLLFDSFQALKDQRSWRAHVHWTDHLYFYTQVPGLSGVRDFWIMQRRIS